MNASTEPFGLPDNAPELARRFAVIMAGLGALIARRFLKMPHLSRFTVQLWNYLNRATRRFYRALTRKSVKARARVGRADDTRVRPVALPTGRGWIVRELGWEAAAYLSHLEVLLGEIAAQASLAAAPGAGRILRPICRMLGVSAAVTPKSVAAVPEEVRASRVSGRSQGPHPGPLPPSAGEGEGPLPAADRIFPTV